MVLFDQYLKMRFMINGVKNQSFWELANKIHDIVATPKMADGLKEEDPLFLLISN